MEKTIQKLEECPSSQVKFKKVDIFGIKNNKKHKPSEE